MAKGPQPVGFFALGVGGYHRRASAAGRPCPGSCSVSRSRRRRWSHGRRPSTAATTTSRSGSRTCECTTCGSTRGTIVRERLRFAGGAAARPSAEHAPRSRRRLRAWWRATARRRAAQPGPCPVASYARRVHAGARSCGLGMKTRYAMPIAPAVAVLAGTGLRAAGPAPRTGLPTAALAATVGLFVYQVVLVTLVIPTHVQKYSAPRRLAPSSTQPSRRRRRQSSRSESPSPTSSST